MYSEYGSQNPSSEQSHTVKSLFYLYFTNFNCKKNSIRFLLYYPIVQWDVLWAALCNLAMFLSRPGQSQGLHYKHLCYWLFDWFMQSPTALRRRYAQTVRNRSFSYKIDYVIGIHQCSGSKGTAILMKGLILPVGGVASGRVCACSLRSQTGIKTFFCELGYFFIQIWNRGKKGKSNI